MEKQKEERKKLPENLPVIVTGATGGIGREIALALARLNVPMILACRSELKYLSLWETLFKTFPEVNVSYLPLDLNDSHSVMETVNILRGRPLAGIINNAGVMMRDFEVSPDGPETTLNVNYFNTRLLNQLLLPQIMPGGSVVFTTSVTRKAGRRDRLPEMVTKHTFGQLRTYALSKKLITNFAAAFVEEARPRRVTVNCCDPGVVDSGMITMHRWFDPLANIFFRPFIRTARNGAVPALRALFSPRTGRIFTLKNESPIK